ncbi:MAG: oxygen-dependent coproporphyrinogen oxidase [Myxococcota bacterium]
MSDLTAVRTYLETLQDTICDALENEDGTARFDCREILRDGGGASRPRVLSDGSAIERTAVHYSHTVGKQLPPAASERRPELVGGAYEAASVSLIVHPRNPYVPTAHANFRIFSAQPQAGGESVWWFGGGFDLTPYYGFEEDVVHWHRTARDACDPFGAELYPEMKRACDEYFYLAHRDEPRGVGGLFFDDLEDLPSGPDGASRFERCFAFVRSVSGAFLEAYLPILRRRKDHPHGERERNFQLYRRGRYVEYNLIWDRGTRFGLQVAGRAESILASLPPVVHWRYDWHPEPGTAEARLYDDFLRPRDWLDEFPD